MVVKTEKLKAVTAQIPGDPSSAAFFIAGVAMTPGSQLRVEGVCLNPTRIGFLEVLKRMGADIKIQVTHDIPEPLGVINVKGAELRGTIIRKDEIPSLIDEIPILMTVMSLAKGESVISGAEELRVKETDRIKSMTVNLSAVGAHIKELSDGCEITGVKQLAGAKIDSFGDHRTAMSLAIGTLSMAGSLEIRDIDCVGTSFPTFFDTFNKLKQG